MVSSLWYFPHFLPVGVLLYEFPLQDGWGEAIKRCLSPFWKRVLGVRLFSADA